MEVRQRKRQKVSDHEEDYLLVNLRQFVCLLVLDFHINLACWYFINTHARIYKYKQLASFPRLVGGDHPIWPHPVFYGWIVSQSKPYCYTVSPEIKIKNKRKQISEDEEYHEKEEQ